MKPFSINRSSWHYKLNKQVFNGDAYDMERVWEPLHSNFCAYWRATIFRLIGAAILFILALALVVILLGAILSDPISAAIVLGGAILVIGTIIGLAVFSEYIQERKLAQINNNEQPKTLLGKQYMAWKSKICPSVDFK